MCNILVWTVCSNVFNDLFQESRCARATFVKITAMYFTDFWTTNQRPVI